MTMRIGVISDTHTQEPLLPEGLDMLVHCGDVTQHGDLEELMRFIRWFGSLPIRHKIFIGGNHDWVLEDFIPPTPPGVHYLYREEIELEGLRIFGDPARPRPAWLLTAPPQKQTQRGIYSAFGIMPDHRIETRWASIPEGLDILITHVPPQGIGDLSEGRHHGCPALLRAVERTHPRLHLFGHIHEGTGQIQIGHTRFVNGCIETPPIQIVTI